MQISELYQLFKTHPVVSTDSRNCPQGSIFFALKGENFNGNFFAEKALDNGCSYAVIDDISFKKDDRYIFVENALQALRLLAQFHRLQFHIPVIGITGTNGKTTTKELIAAVLGRKYKTLFTQGNLNNHIGVPLTLLQMDHTHQIAVIEMGANHPGEIRESVEIASPDYGIITNVGKAHLEGFGSFEGVIRTKGELYDFLRLKKGMIFINKKNSHLWKMAEGLSMKTYAVGESDADISGNVFATSPFVGLEWKERGNPNKFSVKTNLIGEYNAENMLAAICIGRYFNVPNQEICFALEHYMPTNNRSQLTETAQNKLIIDTYNANPTSMEAALHNFSKMDFEHKTLLLGDMLELGEYGAEEHQRIVELIKKYRFNQVFLVGRQFSMLQTPFPSFLNIEEFLFYLNASPIRESCVLIKGSHGIHLEKAIEKL